MLVRGKRRYLRCHLWIYVYLLTAVVVGFWTAEEAVGDRWSLRSPYLLGISGEVTNTLGSTM